MFKKTTKNKHPVINLYNQNTFGVYFYSYIIKVIYRFSPRPFIIFTLRLHLNPNIKSKTKHKAHSKTTNLLKHPHLLQTTGS